ncbi:MAG: U32 family peptidase, partial [Clostridia bacterium]|nr:U32 family peptidase [Clostridia bacterium]
MELLLPAGNFESVKAAVQNGADAVYFGGQKFNARRNASNFDDGLLEDAVNYCRLRNVKTHITLNTLLFDKELNDAFAFAKKLYEIGADAVIVQDIGLIRILRDKLPELTIHASTQLGVHNIEGAALMREMGVKRVVLAREMRLCEIKKIHENVDIELEAFAHGAMCVSFSGQCLFSSMVGARSGNRGKCAQPCRKCIEADAKGNKEIKAYDLSLADMCMIEHLDKMKEAGISCIKIEGRMKRSEYVAAAARAYRAAIDGADTTLIAAHKRTLETVFERGGFSTANYFENDRKTGCIATSNADDALYNELKKTYESDKRLINASFELELYKFEYPRLKMSLPQNAVEVEAVGSNLVQKAEKPQNVERLKAQIGKLGGTVFVCSDCSVCMDDDAFISAGELNELRRNACKMMEDRLLEKKKSGMGMSSDSLPKVRAFSADKNMLIQAMVSNANQARHAFEAGADEVVLYPHDYESAINEQEKLQKYRDNKKLLLNLPHVVLSSDDAETIKRVLKSGLTDGAVANNIGQIEWIKEQKLK